MTLPSSGPLTSNQILTELIRPVDSVLNSTDADLIELAGRSDFTIPDDFYGKSALGSVLGTYTINVGVSGSSGIFLGYSEETVGNPAGYGLLNGQNATYWESNPNPPYRDERAINFRETSSPLAGQPSRFTVEITGRFEPAGFVTAIKIGGEIIKFESLSIGSTTTRYFFGVKAGKPPIWTLADVGSNKIVEIYGR